MTYHISTATSKTKILISLSIKCFSELVNYGAQAILEREYGPFIVQPESGYDFSVEIDLESLPAEQEAKDDLIRRISLLRRNAMAAPFEQAFDEYAALHEEASKYTSESAPQGMAEGGAVKTVHYRDEEAIYIKASHDRVTVIFSTIFREETDRIFGKVFLQEFVDARRRAIQNAPQVLFRNDPPLELQGLPGLPTAGAGEVGFITFGIRARTKLDVERTILTDDQSSFPVTSRPRDEKKSSRISKRSVTISTTTSRPPKRTLTLGCGDAPPTSCKVRTIQSLKNAYRPSTDMALQCCEGHGPKPRKRNERRQAEGPLGSRHELSDLLHEQPHLPVVDSLCRQIYPAKFRCLVTSVRLAS